ncbi:NAD(P)-binding protein [Marinibaculum pumilum]|uniref:NAD(P)-binding protein n=1 Tax=Marinibaculum pumilum TaxID=1766165 RepID=A0ABV7L018_9PROT
MAADKERIAILGGGVGALCAAVALSEIDPKGEKYEITLYQLGWRLGGKCASGRNAEYGQRIEEHGLHIWAGFYDNAFTVMRVVCNALKLPLDQLFVRENLIFYAEEKKGAVPPVWEPWPFWFQPARDPDLFPGRDSLWAPPDPVMPSLAQLVQRTIGSVIFELESLWKDWPGDQQAETRALLARLPAAQRARLSAAPIPETGHHPLLELARRFGAGLESDVDAVRRTAEDDVSALLGGFQELLSPLADAERLLKGLESLPTDLRHVATIVNLGLCMVVGMIRHGCLRNGLEAIDDLEFRAFLAEQDKAAAHNEIVTALYEYIFAFKDGDHEQPAVSACSAVQGLIRLYFTYKGAFFFKGLRGMGDILCTPIYQLLKSRGVRFRFFHKVTELHPTADGSAIGTILIDQQAATVGDAEYRPLVPVQGFDCWPSTPEWAQLVNGEQFKAEGVDFEAAYGPVPQPPPVARLELKRGQDFDKVVLGISVGALAEICKPLVDRNAAWADMVANLATVRTKAYQLWMDRTVDDLCPDYCVPEDFKLPAPETVGPVVATCAPPFDTYCDMSQLLPAEEWPVPEPKSVAYYCAVMDETAPNNEALAADAVKTDAIGWMKGWLHNLWPEMGRGADFRWDLLHASADLKGADRFDAQYWRANIDPTERYVLSLPGTLRHRMEPGGSGFENLFLAGDWTRVPEINAGCVEVAAMSGLGAASALSGVPIPIVSLTPEPQPTNDYVDYAGWTSLAPAPATSRHTSFYSFAFPTGGTAGQDFLDRSFNKVAGYQRFRTMLDLTFLLIVQSRRTGAPTPPYNSEGTMDETDIGFWLPVGSYAPGGVLPQAIGLVPAYLFVDNGWATMTGREVWGMPKYYAEMVLPQGAGPAYGPFEVSALAIRDFAPDARAREHRVLSLTGTDIAPVQLVGRDSSPAASPMAPAELFRRLCGCAEPGQLQALEGAGMPSFLGGVGFGFTTFCLKQARAADSPTAACYQELLQGSLDLTRVHAAGLLPGSWTLELHALDSLPLIADLGLGTPTDGRLSLTTGIGLWAEMDFVTGVAHPMT